MFQYCEHCKLYTFYFLGVCTNKSCSSYRANMGNVRVRFDEAEEE